MKIKLPPDTDCNIKVEEKPSLKDEKDESSIKNLKS